MTTIYLSKDDFLQVKVNGEYSEIITMIEGVRHEFKIHTEILKSIGYSITVEAGGQVSEFQELIDENSCVDCGKVSSFLLLQKCEECIQRDY